MDKDLTAIQRAAEVLRAGGLVGLPTETVYGLGANALDEKAVACIFEAKGRPQDNPLIVHVCDYAMMHPLVQSFPKNAQRLTKAYWPGPLTIVLPRTQKIPAMVSAGLPTVAIRMPANPIARAIIDEANLPIAAPSGNVSGRPSPTKAEHMLADMDGKIELIIDGGECRVGVESTVVSFTGDHPVLLRPGGVTLEMLKEILPDISVAQAVLSRLEEGAQAESPGMKYKHYAPKTPVTLIKGSREAFLSFINQSSENLCVLAFEEDIPFLKKPFLSMGKEMNAASQAQRLFAALREVDQKKVDHAYVRMPSQEGMGLAVINRLLRAAGFEVITLAD